MGALESHDQYFHLLQVISVTLKSTEVKREKSHSPAIPKCPQNLTHALLLQKARKRTLTHFCFVFL